jgi:hypothetical protein
VREPLHRRLGHAVRQGDSGAAPAGSRGAPGDGAGPAGEVDMLVAALDRAWNRWEFRVNNGLQVLNFFLLAAAILVAAYVSALSSHLNAVAAAIAVFGAAASGVAYVVGRRQSQVAALAVEPMRDIQERLAQSLSIDSLRMIGRYQRIGRSPFPGTRSVAQSIPGGPRVRQSLRQSTLYSRGEQAAQGCQPPHETCICGAVDRVAKLDRALPRRVVNAHLDGNRPNPDEPPAAKAIMSSESSAQLVLGSSRNVPGADGSLCETHVSHDEQAITAVMLCCEMLGACQLRRAGRVGLARCVCPAGVARPPSRADGRMTYREARSGPRRGRAAAARLPGNCGGHGRPRGTGGQGTAGRGSPR